MCDDNGQCPVRRVPAWKWPTDRPDRAREDLTPLHMWWWGNARLQRCSGRPRRVTLIFLRVYQREWLCWFARARACGDGIYRVPVHIFAEGTGIESRREGSDKGIGGITAHVRHVMYFMCIKWFVYHVSPAPVTLLSDIVCFGRWCVIIIRFYSVYNLFIFWERNL